MCVQPMSEAPILIDHCQHSHEPTGYCEHSDTADHKGEEPVFQDFVDHDRTLSKGNMRRHRKRRMKKTTSPLNSFILQSVHTASESAGYDCARTFEPLDHTPCVRPPRNLAAHILDATIVIEGHTPSHCLGVL